MKDDKVFLLFDGDVTADEIIEIVEEHMVETKGGPGSGNFGHYGRPGQRGGSGGRSGPGGGVGGSGKGSGQRGGGRRRFGGDTGTDADFVEKPKPAEGEGSVHGLRSGSQARGKFDDHAYKKLESAADKENMLKGFMSDYKEQYTPKAKQEAKVSGLSPALAKKWGELNSKIGQYEGMWRGVANKGWSQKGKTRRKFFHMAVGFQNMANDLAFARDNLK